MGADRNHQVFIAATSGLKFWLGCKQIQGNFSTNVEVDFRAPEETWCIQICCLIKKSQLTYLLPHPKEILCYCEKELAAPRNFSWAEYASLPWGELPYSSFGLKDLHLCLLLSKGWCHKPSKALLGPHWDSRCCNVSVHLGCGRLFGQFRMCCFGSPPRFP